MRKIALLVRFGIKKHLSIFLMSPTSHEVNWCYLDIVTISHYLAIGIE